MRTFPDIRMRALLGQANVANKKLADREHESALVDLRALEGRLTQLGLHSSWVKWALAVSLDMTSEPIAAFDKIGEALVSDPLNPANHQSYEIIVNRLRAIIADATEGDPQIAAIYARLQREDECDVATHVCWAGYLAFTRKLDEAAKVLAAVTLLAPASIDAWRARAAVEAARGRATEAAECQAQLSVLQRQPVALGIMSVGGES